MTVAESILILALVAAALSHNGGYTGRPPAQKRVHIAVIGADISVTSSLVKLLESVEGAIVFSNPYLEVRGTRVVVTPMQALFDCSFIRNASVVSAALRKESCRDAWVASTRQEIEDCERGLYNQQMMFRRCRRARAVILDVANLPHVSQRLNNTNAIAYNTKVIHVVMHPLTALRLAWSERHDASDESFATLALIALRVCSGMTRTASLVDKHDPDNVVTVQYEQLSDMSELNHMLQLTGIERRGDFIASLSATWAEMTQVTATTPSLTDIDFATRIIHEVPACRAVCDRFYGGREALVIEQ